MAKRKRTNYDLQDTTQKTKYIVLSNTSPTRHLGVCAGAPEARLYLFIYIFRVKTELSMFCLDIDNSNTYSIWSPSNRRNMHLFSKVTSNKQDKLNEISLYFHRG